MKAVNTVEQLERLEDQLQAFKWAWKPPRFVGRLTGTTMRSIVAQTAGLLRGRLPNGRGYERRLRREWEQNTKQRAS